MTGPLCRHCQRNRAHPGRRGLCLACHGDRAVRDQYPVDAKFAPRREPTAAEVEAMVAEQMRCLPAWWAGEAEGAT